MLILLAKIGATILGLLGIAIVLLRFFDEKQRFPRSAFPNIFESLEETNYPKPFLMKVEFEDSPQWFILRREPTDTGPELSLCLPRVGYTDEDYQALERTYLAHGFEFQRCAEMSRFFAAVPVRTSSSTRSGGEISAHAARLFMQALNIDPATPFRRSIQTD
ncbi:MAG: hypothetical protein AAGF61_14375 [Pseudomonadota bacterium]